jgi:hypothetical protein
MKHGIIGSIDVADRLWCALLPIVAYLLVIAAGVSLLRRSQLGLDILALALILLLLLGIRNAWDMNVWIIDRRQHLVRSASARSRFGYVRLKQLREKIRPGLVCYRYDHFKL